jgi:hypothetical protein
MSAFSAWLAPRRRVLTWIAMGYASFAIVFAAAFWLAPRLAPIPEVWDRVLLALQLTAGPAAVQMLILQGLWRVADTAEAENPAKGGESERFKVNQRVMTNTVEQAGIFVPMFVALAIRIDPEKVWVLPIFMGIWCVGRILFWIGYQLDPVWRAIGMDWTSAVAMITAGWLFCTLF